MEVIATMSPKDLLTEQDHEEWLQSLGEGERREYEDLGD